MKKNIALLGGTFDPIHNGHIRIADSVLTQLPIDQFWFVPAANPPHKTETMFSFKQRISFIKEAIFKHQKKEDMFFVYEDDCRENDKSYTIYLIKELKSKFPNYNFSFIIGADNVTKLKTWYNYEELIEKVNFIVINRETDDKNDWQTLEYYHKLIFLNSPPINISSSEIRNMILNNEDVSNHVPYTPSLTLAP